MNDLERELEEIKLQLVASRKRCKNLEERLSKQTMECYAEIDRQSVEIALLKFIIEEKGGFHKLHVHVREGDSQE